MNDKYIFETENEREMRLVANRHKFRAALSELKEWYIQILNCKDVNENTKYLIQGNVYTLNETQNKKFSRNNNIEKDEHGLIKDCKTIYFQEDILRKIEEILDGTFDLIEWGDNIETAYNYK